MSISTIIFSIIILALFIIIVVLGLYLKVYSNLCVKYLSDVKHAQELENFAESEAAVRVEYFKNMITNVILEDASVIAPFKKLGYEAIVKRVLDDQNEEIDNVEQLKFWDY